MLLEFFSGNVLFHSYGRNRLFGAIIKCHEYQEWAKDWDIFLQQERQLKPHALYIDGLEEDEGLRAVKKVRVLLNKNIFWVGNTGDILGLYFHDMWQLAIMQICMERSGWI